jgi:uncharacterized protein with HEPN domain
MSPSAREYLQHILDETEYIISSLEGLSKADFVRDETLKRAYVRSLEIMGEAVKQFQIRYVKNTQRSSGDRSLECAIA